MLFFITSLLLNACKAPVLEKQPLSGDGHTLTAREIIDKNLDTLGGADRIRAIHTLMIDCLSGSALLTPTEKTTIYLKKPDLLKQESLYRLIVNNGKHCISNAGGKKTVLQDENLEGIRYRLGFYHNAFSLLAWEPFFPSAELVEIKEYGSGSQYVLNFPGAVNGRDLIAYIDAKTFLIDRLVYTVAQAGAGLLTVVNRLRDYKEFAGIQVPTRLVYDKVGWEEAPSHFIIEDLAFNPEIDDTVFENDDMDFGEVASDGEQLKGEMRGTSEDTILTNIRLEDLATIGVQELDWVDVRTDGASIRARVLRNIQASAKVLKHDELYLCGYPISGYPRLMIMSLGLVVQEQIPYARGRALYVTKSDEQKESQETIQDEAKPTQGGDHDQE
ncbi:MAG: hypothetical protein ABIK28_12555, partial [Planctomycetota bacterium]